METSALPVVDEQIPYMDNKFPIPIDLFVSKKLSKGFRSNSYIRFTDSFGNLVFKSERGTQYQELKSTDTSHSFKVVVDSSGNALVSIHKIKEGLFNGYRLKDGREELMWRARKTVNQFAKTDFEVSLLGENIEDSETILKMKGCPFKRSCTIYKGDAILAQSSLMYQLGIKKAFVPRSRFRVTLFPGCSDHVLVVALVIVFLDGRKLWV